MESPIAYHLGTLRWSVFVHPTFKGASYTQGKRVSMQFRFLRGICAWYGMRWDRLLWVWRYEKGELGRTHCHSLIGGIPFFAVSPTLCYALNAEWERIGGGRCRSNIFDARLSGAEYVSKGLCSGSDYESGRMRETDYCQLMLSKSVVAIMTANARRNGVQAAIRTGAQTTHTNLNGSV